MLSTYRTVFVHSLEGPVLLALDTNIEPVAPAVEIFSHLSDGCSVGIGDLANVGKLHPDNHSLNNKSLSDVKLKCEPEFWNPVMFLFPGFCVEKDSLNYYFPQGFLHLLGNDLHTLLVTVNSVTNDILLEKYFILPDEDNVYRGSP